MKIKPGLIVALGVLLALTACEPTPHREVLAANGAAADRWHEQGLTDYTFHFKRLCNCADDYAREVQITVLNGEIADITFADDDSQVPQDMWNDYPTIADLFEVIEAAATENAFSIQVTYHPFVDYPQSIVIDYDERIADEETYWQASDVEAVATQPPQTLGPQVAQLLTPQQAKGRFADSIQGCSLLSSDGGSVGCYREVVDQGSVDDWLEIYRVGSSEPTVRFHLYSGQQGVAFDPATVDTDGITAANALLRQGGYENVGVNIADGDPMEYRIRQMDGEIIVSLGQREGRAPLPTLDPELVVTGFRGDPPECLYWLPRQLTVFDREGIAAVRLQPIAAWNQDDPNSPCFQPPGPADEPLNDLITGPEVGRTVVMAAGMTWPASQQTSAPPAPVQIPSREEAVTAIEKLGGKVTIDADRGVVAVEFAGEQSTDAALDNLKGLSDATSLSLFNSKVTDTGLASLKGLDQLTTLYIAGSSRITDTGLAHIKVLPNLKDLTLPHTVTDSGLEHVGKLSGLTSLWIGSSQISDAGLLHLKDLRLQSLVLDGTSVSDAGLEHVQGMRDSLRLVRLAKTRVTDAGLVYLAGFNELNFLGLNNTQVTDAGLATLSALPKLFTLQLANTAITDRGLESLKQLQSLGYLNLDGTSVTEAGVDGLKNALPNLTVARRPN